MYEILITSSKYMGHKREIKVNILTPDNLKNSIYQLMVFKFDPEEPNVFKKPELV